MMRHKKDVKEELAMSPLVRWILALVLLFFIVGFGLFSVIAIAFGSDSCSQIGGGASTPLLMASPVVMAIGVIVAAIQFGLNKRWQLWLASLAIGGTLGMCGYVFWFALIAPGCG